MPYPRVQDLTIIPKVTWVLRRGGKLSNLEIAPWKNFFKLSLCSHEALIQRQYGILLLDIVYSLLLLLPMFCQPEYSRPLFPFFLPHGIYSLSVRKVICKALHTLVGHFFRRLCPCVLRENPVGTCHDRKFHMQQNRKNFDKIASETELSLYPTCRQLRLPRPLSCSEKSTLGENDHEPASLHI